ncbi:uncharacterized protein E0L32_002843 [Thyridium curvatum]|uniref:Actin-like ATPase domain-containing protein n=1 Tax=Thyridium curvatum TaxID=1093900 RepID=A0A507B666_9PEZI|nr:uncharacterized protein E0L32_002843 [Thyridium curvatum]TPX17742.1 hypothetical protein E0L32_002843 [Thyridium curvatum]
MSPRTYGGLVKIESDAANQREAFIVGLDFGTTCSGVAYASTGNPDLIQVVIGWPVHDGPRNTEGEKTATAIRYVRSGKVTSIQWGGTIHDDEEALRWFKLLLAELGNKYRKAEHILHVEDKIARLNKQPGQVIADYLGKLWEKAIESIDNEVGSFENARLHIVMTIPAIWTGQAQDAMEAAARQAGLLKKPGTKLSFISEPEAAAMATLRDAMGRADLRVGDSFIVVDCGGGTTDLISYRILKLDPLTVEEVAEGAGDVCGARDCDAKFEAVLKQKFGEDYWERLPKSNLREIIRDHWEFGMKRIYGLDSTKPFSIPVPWECWGGSQNPVGDDLPIITFERLEIEDIFEPTFTKILELVTEQIKRVQGKTRTPPKYIMLVGGFGRCGHLFERMKEHVSTTKIKVLQAKHALPWTAVCRGAVIHGLNQQKTSSKQKVAIESRIARASYGICQDEEQGRGAMKDLEYDELLGRNIARNQMKWLIRKGNKLSTKKASQGKFSMCVAKDERPSKHKIYTSNKSPPPKRRDANVQEFCVVRFDPKKAQKIINFDDLDPMTSEDGETFYNLEFEYDMTFHCGKFEFAVFYKGEVIGRAGATMEY